MRRFLGASVAGLALIAWALTPASANNFGVGALPYYADNSTHVFFYNDLSTEWHEPSEWTRGINLHPTVMSTAVTTNHSTADVSTYDDFYSSGVYATTTCPSVSGNICTHWHIRYDKSTGDPGLSKRKSIACHEQGHTVGLDHDNSRSTCMHNDDVFPTDYTDHDRAHLTSRYS